MNILITGVASFLGRYLAEFSLHNGAVVYGLLREQARHKKEVEELQREYPNLHLIYMDMADIEDLASIDISIEACIHLAWEGIGAAGRMNPQVQEKNILATTRLLSVLEHKGIKRFVFAGSQAEYGLCLEDVQSGVYPDILQRDIDESFPTDPISEYGKAKKRVYELCKKFVRDKDMEYIHTRIFSIYGSGDHDTSLISSCIQGALCGQEVVLSPCLQYWNYMHIDDLIRGLFVILEQGIAAYEKDGKKENASIINIAGKENKPLKEFVSDIQEVCKTEFGLETDFVFREREVGAEKTTYLKPDISKLLRVYIPRVDFKSGIRQMIEKELEQN